MIIPYKEGDEVELVGTYTYGGSNYPIHTERIGNGINHGVVVNATTYLAVRWDEYASEGGLAVDASCIRHHRGKPLTEQEEREVLESIAHTGDGLNSIRAQLRAEMRALKLLDPDLFKEVAES